MWGIKVQRKAEAVLLNKTEKCLYLLADMEVLISSNDALSRVLADCEVFKSDELDVNEIDLVVAAAKQKISRKDKNEES